MNGRKLLSLVAVVTLMTTAFPNQSQAVVLSSSELIEDSLPFDVANLNLTRTRVDANGNVVVETNDATIISDNQIDNDFGVVNNNDVSYRHDLTWLTPPADVFVFASLTIKSFGALGSNDIVSIETIELGSLVNGTLGSGFFSTTVFASTNPVVLNALLADGYLEVSINKNANGGLSNLNLVSVYSSKLDVRYEPVPEPTTMALFGSGMLLAAARRRRARAE